MTDDQAEAVLTALAADPHAWMRPGTRFAYYYKGAWGADGVVTGPPDAGGSRPCLWTKVPGLPGHPPYPGRCSPEPPLHEFRRPDPEDTP